MATIPHGTPVRIVADSCEPGDIGIVDADYGALVLVEVTKHERFQCYQYCERHEIEVIYASRN